MSGSVETGNKILVNTNLVEMHGIQRTSAARLQASVFNGDTTATVEAGLDWVAGEKIYFAPTNHQFTHSEYKTIVSYDSSNGALTIDTPFEFYHFGADANHQLDYDNLDQRGEVRLLTRNVKVVGFDDGDQWGCNILSMDRVEADLTERLATTKFDSIEVAQCSQQNTFKAAIRFENTGGNVSRRRLASRSLQDEAPVSSYVKNSVVHNSQAWSLYIANSNNILIQGSDFIGAKAVGVNLKSIRECVIDGIFVGDVTSRVNEAGDKFVDKEACVAYCSYFEPNPCQDNKVINSIAAGCPYTGFTAPGHTCGDDTDEKFRNNVAHSSDRTGAHIYPDPSDPNSGSCYEGSYFKAYKNRDGGLTTMYNTVDQRMSHMTFVDNEKGITLQSSGERDEMFISLTDVKIYGENENSDAPVNQEAYCPKKTGLQLFGGVRGSKALHPTSESSFPIHKQKTYSTWGGTVTLTDVTFNNFKALTGEGCGKKMAAIKRNKYQSDYIPIHKFQTITFNNVENDALVYLEDPDPGWANPTDCIEWPCTGPNNVVLEFTGTTFSGAAQPDNTDANFQIVGSVVDAINAYQNCALVSAWSAGRCTNDKLGMLLFESLDADTEDRTIQPVNITSDATGYSNDLNAFMDHRWDGFYTGQVRLSRFPAQIETDQDYTVRFTGTPAQSFRFTLIAGQGAMKIKIPYNSAGSYTVFADGE